MNFKADKQTLSDLNVTGKYKPGSIFSLFNKVQTTGGEKLLEQLFSHPLTDADEINKRSSIFDFFQQKSLKFPVTRTEFDEVENYLNGSTGTSIVTTWVYTFRSMVLSLLTSDPDYEMLKDGLSVTLKSLKRIAEFYKDLELSSKENPYREEIALINSLLNDKRLLGIYDERIEALSFTMVCRYDHLLKHTLKGEFEALLQVIYHLDIYTAVSQVAAARNFTYAKAIPSQNNVFDAECLYHPVVENAIGNNIRLDGGTNMMFLTGANMAGKSTLMKTFGIAMYLAHMGFPVAAKNMRFSVKDGIYSSINVPDDLGKGYSHFYAEVLRVKKAAQAVISSKNMIIMFDELFKGTNVKDAYEATLAVTKAFAEYQNCFFIISTHIIEVGEALCASTSNIGFNYMPTIMKNTKPEYTYQLKEGITSDRQGMIIIENEGILGLLES